ncbi:MAG: YicC family protein [Clostridia bacterium]|nr:YicC family protein [Clostridia bacterium]
MYSMTGYGKAEYSEGGVDLAVELKSVNNRNFDFNAKMPRAFICFEDAIRKTVAEYIKRGRIELFVNFSDNRESRAEITVDFYKAEQYYAAAKKIAENLNIANDCTVSYLMKCPDVVKDDFKADGSEFEEILISTVKAACEKFNEMRKTEGAKLVADMLARMDTISALTEKVALRAPLVAAEYKERLKNRIQEALKDVKYDEARLLNEVAFYTDKVNIDEELTRLKSHISQFKSIVNTVGAGKKLDFLMQEFNRETNTICSKSNDLEITGYGLSLKNEIEKVREQVQNLE